MWWSGDWVFEEFGKEKFGFFFLFEDWEIFGKMSCFQEDFKIWTSFLTTIWKLWNLEKLNIKFLAECNFWCKNHSSISFLLIFHGIFSVKIIKVTYKFSVCKQINEKIIKFRENCKIKALTFILIKVRIIYVILNLKIIKFRKNDKKQAFFHKKRIFM